MNLWLEGPAAWSELDWVGQEVEIGDARLQDHRPRRALQHHQCEPRPPGRRDTQIPALLRKTFGHMDFGVYAQVTRGGQVRKGDTAHLV